jgi:hypothetical protein
MRDGDFELVTLRSGARAVRHCGHGEVMHPAGGPWIEANRLYVEQSQLAARLTESPSRTVCIFDIGLGAATNAVAALTCAQQLGGSIEICTALRSICRPCDWRCVIPKDSHSWFPFTTLRRR